jgi:hypothetical protein
MRLIPTLLAVTALNGVEPEANAGNSQRPPSEFCQELRADTEKAGGQIMALIDESGTKEQILPVYCEGKTAIGIRTKDGNAVKLDQGDKSQWQAKEASSGVVEMTYGDTGDLIKLQRGWCVREQDPLVYQDYNRAWDRLIRDRDDMTLSIGGGYSRPEIEVDGEPLIINPKVCRIRRGTSGVNNRELGN